MFSQITLFEQFPLLSEKQRYQLNNPINYFFIISCFTHICFQHPFTINVIISDMNPYFHSGVYVHYILQDTDSLSVGCCYFGTLYQLPGMSDTVKYSSIKCQCRFNCYFILNSLMTIKPSHCLTSKGGILFHMTKPLISPIIMKIINQSKQITLFAETNVLAAKTSENKFQSLDSVARFSL